MVRWLKDFWAWLLWDDQEGPPPRWPSSKDFFWALGELVLFFLIGTVIGAILAFAFSWPIVIYLHDWWQPHIWP